MGSDLTAGDPTLPPEPEPSSGRIGRAVLKTFLRALLTALAITIPVLVALLVALWVWRLPITNQVAPRLIQFLLDTSVTLQVVRMDTDLIIIEDVKIPNGPSIREIRIVPDPDDATGIIERLEVTDIQVELTLSPDGAASINGLENLFQSDSESTTESAEPLSFPIRHLTLTGLSLIADTPIGQQYLTGDAFLSMPAAPTAYPLAGQMRLNSANTDSAVLIDLALDETGVSADALLDLSLAHWLPFAPDIHGAKGRATVNLNFASGPIADMGHVLADPVGLMAALSGTVETSWTGVSLSAKNWPDIRVADSSTRIAVEGGQATLSLPTAIEAETASTPEFLTDLLPPLLHPYTDGRPQLVLSQTETGPAAILRPGRDNGWQISFGLVGGLTLGPVSGQIQPDSLSLDSTLTPTRLTVADVSLDILRGLDLPRDVTAHLQAGPIVLDHPVLNGVASQSDLALPYSLDATVYGDLAPPVWAKSTTLSIQGDARLRPDFAGADISIAPGGRIQVEGLTGTGDLRLSPRLRLDVAGRDPMQVGLDFGNPVDSLDITGAFRLGGFSIALPGDNGALALSLARQPVSIRYAPKGISLAMGPVDVTEAGNQTGLSRAVLRVDLAGQNASRQTGTVTLTAAGIMHEGQPILPGGLSVNAAVSRSDKGTVTVQGPISLADGAISANTSALITQGASTHMDLSLESAPIRFGPGNLALTDILPASVLDTLPYIPALSGGISLNAKALLRDGKPSGTFRVIFEQLSAVTPSGTLESVDAEIAFNLAELPATLGEQEMTARIRIPGFDPIPTKGRFHIAPNGNIHIPELSMTLFGAGPALVDTIINPTTKSLDGTLRIRRMDLGKSLALLDIQGVAGSGIVSGLLPLRISPDNAVVTDGTLAAEGNGTLQIDNDTVNQALASDQQAVQLLTEAIRDFRYDGLSASVNLPPTGNGVIGLSISGHNPTVLEGHPFALNINLESDFRKLFGVLQDILAMSSAVLGGVSVSSP